MKRLLEVASNVVKSPGDETKRKLRVTNDTVKVVLLEPFGGKKVPKSMGFKDHYLNNFVLWAALEN
jgi:hypothetical protein